MENPKGKRIKLKNDLKAVGTIYQAFRIADSEHYNLSIKWDDPHPDSMIHTADLEPGEIFSECEKCGGAIDTGADHGFCASCQRIETSLI